MNHHFPDLENNLLVIYYIALFGYFAYLQNKKLFFKTPILWWCAGQEHRTVLTCSTF